VITVLSPDRIKQLALQDTLELIETRTVVVPTSPFMFESKVVTDNTGLEQNFVTRHTNSGHYVATFKVVADRDPVVRPQIEVAVINPNDMVVANF
jgi:hypothetical protein